MAEATPALRIEEVIRAYIQACNDADAKAIAACLCPDAVHYSPIAPKWSGPAAIAAHFSKMVQELGYSWTVDQLLVDVDRFAAALEWTSFDRNARVLRGVDWFVFDPHTIRIREIRPYFAAAPHPEPARQEMQDFDYRGRGYPTNAPSGQRAL